MIEQKVMQCINPIFNGEVYLSIAPKTAKLPRAVFFVVSETIGLTIAGVNNYRSTSIQIDCWGQTAEQAKQYADQVFKRLFIEQDLFSAADGQRLTDTHDETLNVYACRWEYTLQT